MSETGHDQERRVVVGADGTESGDAAVRYAAQEAQRRGARLLIVHVVPVEVPLDVLPQFPDGSLQAFGASVVDRAVTAARDVASELDLATQLVSGGRVDRLVEVSWDAELLVLGSRRVSTLELAWTGDTCAGVASRAGTTVRVVPSSWAGPRSRRVVVGYKSDPTSRALVAAGLAEARARSAELLVLHTWRLPGAYDDVAAVRMDDQRWNRAERARIEAELADLRADHPDVALTVHVTHDRPARALVAASCSADLLVISRPAHGAFHHVGGTVRRVLRLSECPVEIIPPLAGPRRSTDAEPVEGREEVPVRPRASQGA